MHIWRHTAYFLVFMVILVISACEAETAPVPPTRVPTLTSVPPTITPTEAPLNTSTPRPTQLPVPRINAEDQADQAFIRIVHASPTIPAISIDIQGLQVASILPYPLATSPASIEAGEYMLTISTQDTPTLIQQAISIAGRSNQIFMISGTIDNPQLSIYDEPTAPLNTQQSRITFVHAIQSGPTLSFASGTETLTDSLDYGAISFGNILPSTPTTISVSSNGQSVVDYPTNLRSRQSIIMIITGTPDAPDIIIFDRQVEGITQIRAIHAAPEVNIVDVYLNGQPIATELGFTRSTERQPFPALSGQLEVFASGTSAEDDPIFSQQVNLRTDQAMSLVIVGSTENINVLFITDDLSAIRPDLTRIAFLNPLAEYDNVNISLQGGTVPGVPELLGYGQVSPSAELEVATYTFLWSVRSVTQDDDDNDLVEVVEDVQLESGRSYLYILTGQDNDTPLIFSENVEVLVDTVDVPSDEELTPTPTNPTRMRFVNAIDEAPTVNIFLDTISVANTLGYGSGTDYTIAPSGNQTVIIQNSQSNAELASIAFEFQLSTNYTIIVYGYQIDGYRIIVIPDNRVIFNNANSASIRLINLSYDSNEDFQLGASSSPEIRAPQAEATTDLDSEGLRPAVPAGINRVSSITEPEMASPQSTLPPGVYDIYIIDPGPNTVAGIFGELALQSQTIYEMVVYQDRFSRNVKGFLLAYGTP